MSEEKNKTPKYAIIDLEKLEELDSRSYGALMEIGCVLSEDETESKFKEVWNAADERCCDEWDNKEYGSGSESTKMDWEQFKLTL